MLKFPLKNYEILFWSTNLIKETKYIYVYINRQLIFQSNNTKPSHSFFLHTLLYRYNTILDMITD